MQLIRVRVSAGAKKNKIERLDETFLSVWVKAKPVRGQANEAVRALVAGHFGVPVAKVRMVKGRLSAHKIMAVME